MEPLQTPTVSHEGLGSWHPAWRPETHTPLSSDEVNELPDNEYTARQNISEEIPEDNQSHQLASQSNGRPPSPPDSTDVEDVALGRSDHWEQVTAPIVHTLGLGINVVPKQDLETRDARSTNWHGEIVTGNGTLENRAHESEVPQPYDFSHPDVDAPLNVDWGSDNDVDPAWGVDSEVFRTNIHRQLNHTNSFPDVPPLQNKPHVHLLPQSQAEDIMEEITEVEAEDENSDSRYNFGPDTKNQHTKQLPFETATLFENSIEAETRPPLTPLDEEVRFEEGLPLIPSEAPNPPSQRALLDNPQVDFFDFEAQRQAATDEDFFASVSTKTHDNFATPKPLQPERKTTSQVLSSIQYPPLDEVHQSQFDYKESPTSENITGTVVSPVITHQAEANIKERNDSSAEKDDDLAALWQAALADDEFLEEESSVDPSSFDGDGEGFLNEDNAIDFPPNYSSPSVPQSIINSDNHTRDYNKTSTGDDAQTSTESPLQSRYTPPTHGHSTFAPIGRTGSSIQSLYAPSGFSNAFGVSAGVTDESTQQSAFTNQVAIQRPLMPEKSQSFADKSKGGYTSPYDIPMEVNRPKRRTGPQQLQNVNNRNVSNLPPPPPRSSSIQSSAMSPYSQTMYQNSPSMSPLMTNQTHSTTDSIASMSQNKPSTGSFFEELPVASKARPSSSAGKFGIPAYQNVPPPPQTLSKRGQVDQAPYQPAQSTVPQPYQLLAPERVLPYSIPNTPATIAQQQPILNARYSPAPQVQPNLPLNRNRYATPPVAPHRPPSVSQIFPHQPRTSSPLTRSTSATQQYLPRAQSEDNGSSSVPFSTGSRRPSLRTAQTEYPPSSTNVDGYPKPVSPLPDSNAPTRAPPYSHPLQQNQLMSPNDRTFPFPTPQNSEAQFPGSIIEQSDDRNSSLSLPERKASVDDQVSPKTSKPQSIQQPSSLNERLGARHNSVAEPNFMVPSDGSEHDPLERWKGCPVWNFGFGGHVVTSFPSRIPRYASGQLVPMIKCRPGEVHVRSGKIIPLDGHIADFPGPLKSKGKKKEVLLWLERGIERLEHQQFHIIPNQIQIDPLKRHEERILLWKILHILIEYDATLEANPNAAKAIKDILSPELASNSANEQASYESQTHSRAISRSSVSQFAPETTNLGDFESLRKLLIEGEREKAVWYAVDKHLWGHALLLASTLPRELWKQVTQEFIRSEVKPMGDKAESLAALYDVLTGSWEESVDKLVPPSARAGLQMVSKTAGSGPTKNALDGLDRWRETLSLILSNRSADDSNALVALGRLLANYGRIEAAHICYIFSRTPGLFGGPDDPQASIALLGADHVKQPLDYGRDLDSILLTEVYEYAFAVLAPSSVPMIAPHLQAHKLNHAMVLAEYGYRDEAQQYCDAIMNILKATTKPSPYYHAQLFSSLDDLTSRLRQAPKDGSSSWITRPSMDKVSGSVWNRLNQFITGDDSDTASTGSGKGIESEAGPFARVAGDTPSISRSQSPDLYGSYANGGNYTVNTSTIPQPSTNSRYAPSGQYTPLPSLDQPSQQIPESQRLGHLESLKRAELQRQSSYSSLPTLSPDLYKKQQPDNYQQAVRPSSVTFPPDHERYAPTASSQASYLPESSSRGPYASHQQDPYLQHNYQPNDLVLGTNQKPLSALYSPQSSMSNQLSPDGPRSNSHQPAPSPLFDRQHSASYEPRSASYEPRSYQPSPVSDKPLPPTPYPPSTSYEPQSSYEPPASSYESQPHNPMSTPLEPRSEPVELPLSYGYEPPSSSYDPPSYDPETQIGNTSPVQEKRKGTLYQDDNEDDGLVAKAAALQKAEKAKKDRETDEAFRKAAELDGKPFPFLFAPQSHPFRQANTYKHKKMPKIPPPNPAGLAGSPLAAKRKILLPLLAAAPLVALSVPALGKNLPSSTMRNSRNGLIRKRALKLLLLLHPPRLHLRVRLVEPSVLLGAWHLQPSLRLCLCL